MVKVCIQVGLDTGFQASLLTVPQVGDFCTINNGRELRVSKVVHGFLQSATPTVTVYLELP